MRLMESLRSVSAILKRQLRKMDMGCRYAVTNCHRGDEKPRGKRVRVAGKKLRRQIESIISRSDAFGDHQGCGVPTIRPRHDA